MTLLYERINRLACKKLYWFTSKGLEHVILVKNTKQRKISVESVELRLTGEGGGGGEAYRPRDQTSRFVGI